MNLQIKSAPVVERISEGMRAYFGKVYNYMAAGLAVSGVVAYVSSQPPLIKVFYTLTEQGYSYSLLGWISLFAPLVLIYMIASALKQLNTKRACVLFFVLSVLNGISLSNIFMWYTSTAIIRAFFITAGSFLALSLFGLKTKKSLSGWGSFLFMGLIGVILASVASLFFHSTQFDFLIAVVSTVVFGGLVAYDTQKLKDLYYSSADERVREAAAISGALSLYIELIQLFRLVLFFLDDRR